MRQERTKAAVLFTEAATRIAVVERATSQRRGGLWKLEKAREHVLP